MDFDVLAPESVDMSNVKAPIIDGNGELLRIPGNAQRPLKGAFSPKSRLGFYNITNAPGRLITQNIVTNVGENAVYQGSDENFTFEQPVLPGEVFGVSVLYGSGNLSFPANDSMDDEVVISAGEFAKFAPTSDCKKWRLVKKW